MFINCYKLQKQQPRGRPEKYPIGFIFLAKLHGVKNAVLIKMNSFAGTFQRLCV